MPADLDLDHLEALDREATPTPWHVLDIPWRDPRVPGEVVLAGDEDPHAGMPVVETVVLDDERDDDGRWGADARLIAATRNALPHLIAEARTAAELRARVLDLIARLEAWEATAPHPLGPAASAGQGLAYREVALLLRAAMQAVDGATP